MSSFTTSEGREEDGRVDDLELAEKMARAEKEDRDDAYYHQRGETDAEHREARRALSRAVEKGETVERIEGLLKLTTGDAGERLWNDLKGLQDLIGHGLGKSEHVPLRQSVYDRLVACRDGIESLIYEI